MQYINYLYSLLHSSHLTGQSTDAKMGCYATGSGFSNRTMDKCDACESS